MEIAGLSLIGVGGFLIGWRWWRSSAVFGYSSVMLSARLVIETVIGIALFASGLGLLLLASG